jgi:hypothetical protein
MAWTLLHPVDWDVDHWWLGVSEYKAWNVYGYGAKLSIWNSGEIHLGFGRYGKVAIQFKVVPKLFD